MIVRPATPADLPRLGVLAGALVRFHHQIDPQRFLLPEQVEDGYRGWFARELNAKQAVIVVAEEAGELLGYAYGRLQERDWNALLDACGALHDVWVEPGQRRRGAARALVQAVVDALAKKGAPRVVLSTASQNAAAQALFASMGFRPTMVEMTRESGA